MARRSERREKGSARLREGGTDEGDSILPRDPTGGGTPRGDGSKPRRTLSDGSTPRNTLGDGSTPRPKLVGAAMARINGSKPRCTASSEAGTAHTPNTRSSEGSGTAKDGRNRNEKSQTTHHTGPLAGTPSPGELFPPTKELTDEEHARATRRSRLQREATEAGTNVSAAEIVRERFSGTTRTPSKPGSESEEASKATRRSAARNTERLRTADASDAVIIGESILIETCSSFVGGGVEGESPFLSADSKSFFPTPLVGPDDSFEPPAWFLEAVRGICKVKTRTPSKPPFIFEADKRATSHNAELLRGFGYDLGKLIKAHESSTLGFGSEFRTVTELRPLLGNHTHFGRLAELLTNGMEYVFNRKLSETEREGEVKAMLARGNHKSARSAQEQVGKLIAKDVAHGFTVPIPVGIVEMIPGAMVQPLGLVQQWTVGPDGERVIKYRLTQDLSFSSDRTAEPVSINSRVDMGSYPAMIYGWCLPRILHYIVSLRIHNPSLLIFISKYDYSDAYRRIAHSAKAATQTVAVNGDTAFVSLRLTFGGSPNPPTWCMFSELVTDLANEIAQCPEWNPEELRSPAQPETPAPIRLPAGVPIALGREMAVLVPQPNRGGKVDGFIDDLINVFVDTPENCARQPHVVPLAMHVTSRPHAGDDEEPVPRRPILSLPKLVAEGRPEEVQTVLGWNINTRRLEIALPNDKYVAWLADINSVRKSGTCSHAALETLVGRLNHTAYVLPNARHFLSRIRATLGRASGGNVSRRNLTISPEALDDLALWEEFLADAHTGVSMNLLVTRTPNKVCWSDACPYGIGGYNLSGRAWRIRIPQTSPIFGHRGINNLLEFLGMAINIWLSCMEDESVESCILAIGDNTSALGWLHNTSRLDPSWQAHHAHLLVARKVAQLLMTFKCCLASQHVKGELNVVADLLSFAGKGRGKGHPLAFDDPSNDELTERFLTALPSQVPENFVISQLPEDILCWVTQVLRVAESYLTGDRKEATKSTTELGDGTRKEPVVASTLRKTTSNLASAFRQHIGQSPLHLPGSSNMRPFVRMWLKACDNGDPPKRQQRAITPQLLRSMYERSGCGTEGENDSEAAIVAEVAIVAYFFAMRSCEITETPEPGRTKITRLRGVTFRDQRNREMDHRSEDLTTARRVTVTFENQKNGLKNDRRTHEKSGDPVMCPVLRLASLIKRVLRMVPTAGPDTPVSAIYPNNGHSKVTAETLRRNLRLACTLGGGKEVFGYEAADIGTRSIRSGAAMGLFLMNHPVAKIMILGRWSSDAFLDYIRPQVLEWTNQMSADMIRNNSFFDASDDRRDSKDNPRNWRSRPITSADGGKRNASKLHLHH